MKKLVFIAVFMQVCAAAFSQDSETPITVNKTFLGNAYYLRDEPLTVARLGEVLKVDPAAYRYYKQAKTYNIVGSVFSGIGGGCLGWALANVIFGGEGTKEIALVGCGAIAVAIPFSVVAENKMSRAVNLYNEYFDGGGDSYTSYEFHVGATSSGGLGLTVYF